MNDADNRSKGDLLAEIRALRARLEAKGDALRDTLHSDLLQGQEGLDILLDATNDGIWEYHSGEGWLRCSRTWFTMLGYKPEELEHSIDMWLKLLHPDDRAAARAARDAATSGENTRYRVEFRMRTKEGAWKWVLSRGKPVEWDSAGRVVRFIGTHVDISAQKHLEAKLAARAREQRTILNALPDFAFLHDRSGLCLDCFAQGIAHPPVDPAAMPGQDVRRLLPAPAAAFVAHMLQSARLGDPPQSREYDTEGAGGRRSYESCSVRCACDRYLHIIRDLTDRRQADAEMHSIRERLHQAEKLHAVGQLAGGIAHDFNNQMAGIIFLGELLKKEALDPEKIRRYADMMIRRAKASSSLTAQLLNFARKAQGAERSFDVHDVIREVIAFLRHTVDKKICITSSLEAPSSVIRGDASQLENAFLNLGLNARDAMPEGGEMSFSTALVPMEPARARQLGDFQCAAGAYVRVTVEDTGCGMHPDVLRQICEPFFSTKGPGHGTGLGLSSMQSAVKAHGGAYEVISEPGKGTIFHVYLPAQELPVPQAAETEGRPVPGGSGLIMVVDDEDVFRSLSADVLTELGYEVIDFADGRAALAAYRERWQDIRVVLLDVVMPRLDGRDVFHAMKAINPNVNVVVITGQMNLPKSEILLAEGVRAVVQKPFGLAELAEALSEAVAQQHTQYGE